MNSKMENSNKNLNKTEPCANNATATDISRHEAEKQNGEHCKLQEFCVPPELEKQIDEYISHYPQKRSASLMVLHLLQENFRYISPQAIEWSAKKLDLQPINLFELVTFYPMFHTKPVGKYHFRICRTLSCALAGSYELRKFLCEQLGFDPKKPGVQTTPDGLFTVEFVECLASCDKAPVVMLNDKLYEKVTKQDLQKLIKELKENKKE